MIAEPMKVEFHVRVWHTLAAAEAAAHLGVSYATGLSADEGRKRVVQYGPNRLRAEKREPLFRLGLFSNRLMAGWGAATVAFILFATLAPGVQGTLRTVTLSGAGWFLALGAALAGTFWIEARKWLCAGRGRGAMDGYTEGEDLNATIA